MKKLAITLMLFLPALAGAACTPSATGLGLCIPNFGDRWDVWSEKARTNFVLLNSSVPIASSTPTYSSLGVTNWITAGSSIAAGAGFYGAGTGLTAVPAGELTGTVPTGSVDLSTVTTALGLKVNKAGDTMTGQLTTSSSMTAIGGFVGNITGNAGTATALAADPADCTLPNVALGINASGAAACAQPSNVTGTAANITGNLAASQVAAGSLGSNVIASSITLAAMYGAPTLTGTNITAIPNAALVTAVIPSSATGTYPLSISGNAATVTNGVYTTGSYANPSWITSLATAKIDLSTVTTALAGKLTSPATFYVVQTTDYLKAPATFYVVKNTDYLVSPASFTYQSPLVAGTDYLAPDGDGSNLTGVIYSTSTGNYLLRVATATYLATAPGACGAGEFINALTADGTKTCAAPAGGGDVVLASTQTFTGANTFASSVTITGSIVGNTNFSGTASTTTFAGWVDIGLVYVSATGTSTSGSAYCPYGTAVISCSCVGSSSSEKGCRNYYPIDGTMRCVWEAINTETYRIEATCARVKLTP